MILVHPSDVRNRVFNFMVVSYTDVLAPLGISEDGIQLPDFVVVVSDSNKTGNNNYRKDRNNNNIKSVFSAMIHSRSS